MSAKKVFSAGTQFTPGTPDLDIKRDVEEEKVMKALRHAQTTSKVRRQFDTELNQISFLADKKGYLQKLGGVVASLKEYISTQVANFEDKLDDFNLDHDRRQLILDRYVESTKHFTVGLMEAVKDGVSYNTKHNHIGTGGRK